MITEQRLDAGVILDNVRPLVLVVEHDGTFSDAYGAADGVAGYRTEDFVGRHALDFVTEADRMELIHFFLPGNRRSDTHDHSPFPLRIIGPNGERELVDVLPRSLPGDEWRWVLTIMPRRDFPTPISLLEMLMDDASLETVLSSLVSHQTRSTREARVDPHVLLRPDRPGGLIISTERNQIADALETLVDSGNDRLWRHVAANSTVDNEVDQLPAILRIIAEQDGYTSCKITRIDVDGRLEAVMVTMIADPAGAAMFGSVAINQRELVKIVRHIVRREVDDQTLRAATSEDPLTGLSNRGRFEQTLNATDGRTSTLLIVDLDDFKSINDQFGHGVGDQVLLQVACRLRSSCRSSDMVARIGGDEFAVLLDDVDEPTAKIVSERLLEAIARPLPEHLGPNRVTASIGLVHRDAPTDPAALLQAADRAIHDGKRSGREQIVISDSAV